MALPFLALWRNAVRTTDSSSSAKLVAFVLSTYMNSDGYAFPGKDTIATGASVCKRTADRAVGELEDRGLLRVERASGRRSNRYFALLPDHGHAAGFKPGNGGDATLQRTKQNPATAAPESVLRRKEGGDEPGSPRGLRPACPLCGIQKRNENDLYFHIKDVHGDEALGRYPELAAEQRP